MLKHPGGSDAAMCVPDDRPRKKLSFREPEVVAPTRNGAPLAPLTPGPSPRHHHHTLSFPPTTSLLHPSHHHHHHHHPFRQGRPHSIAGIVGLGGLSALGGVPGVANPPPVAGTQCVTSPGTVSVTGVTSMVGNPGLLGPLSIPGVLAGPATPILTPPTSPTYPAPRPPQQPPPNRAVPPPLSPVCTDAPQTPPTPKNTPDQVSTAKMSNQTPSVSSAPVRTPPASTAKGVPQPLMSPARTTGGSLRQPSKHGKPPTRTSSLKKHRSPQSPGTQHVVAFRDYDVPNEKSSVVQEVTSHSAPTLTDASLEDLQLESQAMRIVRTVGQAFEVCHKISVKDTPPSPEPPEDDASEHGSDYSTDKPRKDLLDTQSVQEDLVTLALSDTVNEDSIELPQRPNKLEPLAPPVGSDILSKGAGETYTSPLSEPLPSGDSLPQAGTPLSVHHELQLMREQLEQQQQQTQAAVAQVHLLRDQLAAETAARLEAQARTHQLLVHNKELLEHIQALVLQVRDLEVKLSTTGGSGTTTANTQMFPMPPELKSQDHFSGVRVAAPPTRPRTSRPEEGSSTPSLSSESDPKRDSSGQSSGESVTQAVAQLYSLEPHRLAQVPEDAITLGPYGPTPLGTPRNLNGPITRTASERVARQETLAQLQRMAWARHTTK